MSGIRLANVASEIAKDIDVFADMGLSGEQLIEAVTYSFEKEHGPEFNDYVKQVASSLANLRVKTKSGLTHKPTTGTVETEIDQNGEETEGEKDDITITFLENIASGAQHIVNGKAWTKGADSFWRPTDGRYVGIAAKYQQPMTTQEFHIFLVATS